MGVKEIAAAVRVLGRGQLSGYAGGGSSATGRFEQELADKIGVRWALGVNSGTSALIAALAGAGIGPGDEVLVPAYTWVSTAAAPLAVGAVPILVDVDESMTMDPHDVRRKITPHTRAVLPVHMLNLVCDMDAIMSIADEHDLVVIEDACQAIGASYRGRRVGGIGHAGAFSFNQHKNIKSGEGGALVTSDERIFARAGMYHDVGSYEREGRFETDEPLFVGLNFRMPELSAAILRPQLKKLDQQMDDRRARREAVIDELDKKQGVRVSPHNDEANAVGLTIQFDDAEAASAASAVKGVNRLLDSGRHVYTNWMSILQKRSFHPKMDPYQWAHREIVYDADTCARTLELLGKTCSISIDPKVPTTVLKMLARRVPG